MKDSFKGKSVLTFKDFNAEQIQYLLDLALELKRKKKAGIKGDLLVGKNIALIFQKASTRTRCAFEVAAMDEGCGATFISPADSHFGSKESVEDTARVMGRFYDGISFRGYSQDVVKELADYSGVPVWNALTDIYHPTQTLADMMTIHEHCDKPLSQIKFVQVGDARNNMANSLMIMCAKLGAHYVALGPESLWPEQELVAEMQELCKETGGKIETTANIDEAVLGADVIYTDVWASMGEEAKLADRIKLLKEYRVDMDMMKKTGNDDVLFLHCLPSLHDRKTTMGEKIYQQYGLESMEVTDEVFRSKHSVVFDEAENRLHSIKAIMVATIGK